MCKQKINIVSFKFSSLWFWARNRRSRRCTKKMPTRDWKYHAFCAVGMKNWWKLIICAIFLLLFRNVFHFDWSSELFKNDDETCVWVINKVKRLMCQVRRKIGQEHFHGYAQIKLFFSFWSFWLFLKGIFNFKSMLVGLFNVSKIGRKVLAPISI